VWYCGKQCQRKGWTKHKQECSAYKIVRDEAEHGRSIVASRDLRAGERIMLNQPMCVGPRLVDPTPCCLGCHRAGVKLTPCSICTLPVCSSRCSSSPHHSSECTLLAGKVVPLAAITPLRLIALKFGKQDKFNDCLSMVDNLEVIKTKSSWEQLERDVIQPLVSLGLEGIDVQIVEHMVGVVLSNSFEVVSNGCMLFGLFYQPALMNHHCVANTRLMMDNTQKITVLASVNIKKGQQIKNNYGRAMDPSHTRRSLLLENKFFLCQCSRCSDPSELGTHISDVLCTQCKGLAVAVEPLSLTTDYCCVKCNISLKGNVVRELVEGLQQQLDSLDKNDMKAVLTFMEKCKAVLYRDHGILTECKQIVISGIGRLPGYSMEQLGEKEHRTKVTLCREVLNVLDKVDPGISLGRGLIMFELHSSLVSLGNMEFEKRQVPPQLLSCLLEADKYLKEAGSILQYEPSNSPYGHLAASIRANMVELSQYIEQVKFM